MPETERLSDEKLQRIQHYCTHYNRDFAFAVTVQGDMLQALAELRAYRAGQIVPEGKVLVREEELRAVLSHAAHGFEVGSDDDRHPCVALRGLRDKRPHCPSFGECTSSDTNGDVCYGDCLAAHLAHFGLAEAQDPAHEPTGEEGQR